MRTQYTHKEQYYLLNLARRSLEACTTGNTYPCPDPTRLPARLERRRPCFVGLYQLDGTLRGCTGSFTVHFNLPQSIILQTIQTALSDARFPAVTASELPFVSIEISVLSIPRRLEFDSPTNLIQQLRPGIDGVILHLGEFHSTFLPQVWQHLPEPKCFLTALTKKLGLPGDSWLDPALCVETYQAVVFTEPPINL